MSVRIQLDDPQNFYTNLDFISGRIILNLPTDENISAIHVKLEGESRTMLMRAMIPPGQAHQQLYSQRPARQVPVMENHKILYRVQQVFPSTETANAPATSLGMAYSLRAGKHEYPFRFKMPFNNGCADPQQQAQMGPAGGFAGFGLGGLQQMQYRHVKKTLPPSLTGFPGEAEIRYYIKVTVQRPSIFKENRRSAVGFKFMPIEPPRAPKSTNEVFARRPFAFQPGLPGFAPRKSGLFGKKKEPPKLSDTPPKGEIDARLPSPAILTCNEPIPLRIIARKTSESPESVYLTSLQVTLIGTTEVRAADVVRHETSSWVLVNTSGLSKEIGTVEDGVGKDAMISGEGLWEGVKLPNTVAPSFGTCNIERRYEVEVKVGLGFGVGGDIQPQQISLPLRFQTTIFSGIQPPPALLQAMASLPPTIPSRPPGHPLHNPQQNAPVYDPMYPPQLPPGANPNAMSDAPPSYEDAIAEGIAPADGPRREFSGVTDVNAPELGEKGGSGNGMPRGGFGGSGAGGGGGGPVGREV